MATKHQSIQEINEEEAVIGQVTIDTSVKVADLPVPAFMAPYTKATKLSEYIAFITSGDEFTEIILNAAPIKDGILEPSSYDRRHKAVMACIKAFEGEIATASDSEVIMSFDPSLELVEKVRYRLEGGHWIEYNWRLGKYVTSGRREYPQNERQPRIANLRVPKTILVEMDALSVLLRSGRTVKVGVEHAQAEWIANAIAEGQTLAEALKHRDETYEAKNLNRKVQRQVGNGRNVEYLNLPESIMVDGKPTHFNLVADGTYIMRRAGVADQNFTLDKSKEENKNRMRANAKLGFKFYTA